MICGIYDVKIEIESLKVMHTTIIAQGFIYFIFTCLGGTLANYYKVSKLLVTMSIILSGLAAFTLLHLLEAIPPSKLDIIITEPTPKEEFNTHQIIVRGRVSVFPVRIYVLIHPASEQFSWWIQDSISIDESTLEWEAYCYIGEREAGEHMAFDIVAVGSKNNIVLDVLAGRILYPNQTIKTLPLLNKSNVITVRRGKNIPENNGN